VDVVRVPPGQAPPLWHADVSFFRVDRAGQPAAYFYLDPYSRPAEKRGGAWMDDVQGRSRALAPAGAAVRLPVAHMVCNQSPPVGDTPSLMTFREVPPHPRPRTPAPPPRLPPVPAPCPPPTPTPTPHLSASAKRFASRSVWPQQRPARRTARPAGLLGWRPEEVALCRMRWGAVACVGMLLGGG
jgi:hypothetical protein